MFKRGIALLSLIVFTVSCSCGVPLRLTPIQRGDKKLTCKEVIMGINEAEHYRSQAASTRGVDMGETLMPVCWATGVINSEKAVKAANQRIEYLGHIYDLLDCGAEKQRAAQPRVFVRPLPPAPQRPSRPPLSGLSPYGGAPKFNCDDPRFADKCGLSDGSSNSGNSDEGYDRGEVYDGGGYFLSDKYMHEHIDKDDKVYRHSHPHDGPHEHDEDDPVEPGPNTPSQYPER